MDEMKGLRISVVVPVYNAAPYLRECLAGLEGCEVICVDDGSTDGSGELLERLKDEGGFRNLAVVRQENGGPSAARNRALEMASGDYVTFLDADDSLTPGAMAELAAAVARHGRPDIVQFDFAGIPPAVRRERLLTGARQRRRYLDDVCCIDRFGLVTGKLYRRELLDGLRFDPAVVGEDTLYAVQAVRRARRILLLTNALYNYRTVPGSYSHRPFPGIVPMAERMLALLRAEIGGCAAYYVHVRGKLKWCAAASGLPYRDLAVRPVFAEGLRKSRIPCVWIWLRALPARACRKIKRTLWR